MRIKNKRDKEKILIKPKIRISFFQVILILVGLLLFAYPIISERWYDHIADEAITSYTEDISQRNAEENAALMEEARAYNRRLAGLPLDYEGKIRALDELVVGDGKPFAYIDLLPLGQTIPIYHGTSNEVLQAGVGHLEESSMPVGGESTHAVLTAHSGMRGTRMFDDISEMEIGDIFHINVLGETLAYKIYDTEIVLPHETESLRIQRGRDLVTLITCYPYGVNTHRYLVHAERTDYNPDVKSNDLSQIFNDRTYPFFWACGILLFLLFLWFIRQPKEIGMKFNKHHRHDWVDPLPPLNPRPTVHRLSRTSVRYKFNYIYPENLQPEKYKGYHWELGGWVKDGSENNLFGEEAKKLIALQEMMKWEEAPDYEVLSKKQRKQKKREAKKAAKEFRRILDEQEKRQGGGGTGQHGDK